MNPYDELTDMIWDGGFINDGHTRIANSMQEQRMRDDLTEAQRSHILMMTAAIGRSLQQFQNLDNWNPEQLELKANFCRRFAIADHDWALFFRKLLELPEINNRPQMRVVGELFCVTLRRYASNNPNPG